MQKALRTPSVSLVSAELYFTLMGSYNWLEYKGSCSAEHYSEAPMDIVHCIVTSYQKERYLKMNLNISINMAAEHAMSPSPGFNNHQTVFCLAKERQYALLLLLIQGLRQLSEDKWMNSDFNR